MALPSVDGVRNFRSLEGISAADGRRVKHGVLYRSEALAALSPSARQTIAALGIRCVCDLRSPGEQAKGPMDWPGPPPRMLAVDVLPDARVSGADVIGRIMADATGTVARQVLTDNAKQMPQVFAPSTRRLFDAILDEDAIPLLVACQAGKDRTGYVVSVILLALGVAEQEIVAEFMRSAEHIDSERLHAAMVAWLPDPPDPMLAAGTLGAVSVLPEYIHAAFGTILEIYGSYEAFLQKACGLDDERLARLRDLLLQ